MKRFGKEVLRIRQQLCTDYVRGKKFLLMNVVTVSDVSLLFFSHSEVAMRAVCLLILVSLAVFSIQCQNVPSDSGGENPTLDEVLQRAEGQLIRSFLQKQEDDESANGVYSI